MQHFQRLFFAESLDKQREDKNESSESPFFLFPLGFVMWELYLSDFCRRQTENERFAIIMFVKSNNAL